MQWISVKNEIPSCLSMQKCIICKIEKYALLDYYHKKNICKKCVNERSKLRLKKNNAAGVIVTHGTYINSFKVR